MNYCYRLSAVLGVFALSAAAQPAPAFISAGEWEKNKAEIIRYEVRKIYLGKELVFKTHSVLEGLHYDAAVQKVSRQTSEGYYPALRFTLNYSFKRDVYSRHTQAELLFSRQEGLPLIREEVNILDWDNPMERKIIAVNGTPQLRMESRKEGPQNFSFNETPVFTAEQLFVYLRSLPLKEGYRENIWFLGPMTEDVYQQKPYSSEIAVQSRRSYRDKMVWFVTVSANNSKFYEFYLDVKGLHQVYYAKYPDNTIFQLENIEWKRYSFF